MPAERYYFPGELSLGDKLSLEGSEFHHFCHVMRGKEGDFIELVNGKGFLAHAKVVHLEKKRAFIEIKDRIFEERSTKEVILAQGMPRLNRLDTIVEKGTELGMTQLWLFPGEESERKFLAESSASRLNLLTISAMKQCGRLYLPTIKMVDPLKKWKKNLEFPLYFGDLSKEALLLQYVLLQDAEKTKKGLVFCVGPESGFSENEISLLKELGTGTKLHQNILRTDTASLIALALITHLH